jgi:4-hydroxyacetophenone monooxygenase
VTHSADFPTPVPATRAEVAVPDGPLDVDTLRRALEDAHIPVLIAVLAHLTGDDTWLCEPFLPSRTKGLSDNADGGLPVEVQQRVREAALRLLSDPTESLVPQPLSDARLAAIMSNCMGEDVPVDYAAMMREEMGLAPRFEPDRIRSLPNRTDYSIVIVGAGASGLCMAIQLKLAGVDFTILEKNPELGGTWYENRYPDCGVDTPSYWYSYSFNPGSWSRYYSKRDDVHDYFVRTARDFGVLDHIQFGQRVERARFDEDDHFWELTTTGDDGMESAVRAQFMVSAVGQLNQPKVPRLSGADTFAGEQFHSAAWPDGLDLTGKKVAVVGTGASAMQLVPAIAGQVSDLSVFQRSPQWVAPNAEYAREVSPQATYLMQHVPLYTSWYRMRQVWAFGDKIFESLIIDPEWADRDLAINSVNEGYRRHFAKYIRRELEGRPDLLAKALPAYPPFGKRMLLDNGWFESLRLPNVDLVTNAIAKVTPEGIVDSEGVLHEADVIVYATGFDSLNLLGQVDVIGPDGRKLGDQWGKDDARAYLGMTERGFPNLFFLYGPNTNLGHGGSLLFISECQVRYILDLIAQMMDQGARQVECRAEVRDLYNHEIDAAHANLIWTHPGMSTWYRNDQGRVVTNSPWRLIDLWNMTRSANLEDYELRHA